MLPAEERAAGTWASPFCLVQRFQPAAWHMLGLRVRGWQGSKRGLCGTSFFSCPASPWRHVPWAADASWVAGDEMACVPAYLQPQWGPTELGMPGCGRGSFKIAHLFVLWHISSHLGLKSSSPPLEPRLTLGTCAPWSPESACRKSYCLVPPCCEEAHPVRGREHRWSSEPA